MALAAGLVAACGEARKPKTAVTVEGVVQEIKVYTRRSKLLGETGGYYQVKMTVSGSRDWYANIGKGAAEETDLQRIIGDSVTLRCLTDDATITTCHDVVGLDHKGRNLVKR